MCLDQVNHLALNNLNPEACHTHKRSRNYWTVNEINKLAVFPILRSVPILMFTPRHFLILAAPLFQGNKNGGISVNLKAHISARRKAHIFVNIDYSLICRACPILRDAMTFSKPGPGQGS